MAAAKLLSVGYWKTRTRDILSPSSARIFSTTRTIIKELAPRSKKLSSIPISFIPSNSRKMAASLRSTSVAGGTNGVAVSWRAPSGDGNAWRSSLPFGVSGSASSGTNAEGIMYSGSVLRKCWRSAGTRLAPLTARNAGRLA